MSGKEFSVYIFFPDGTSSCEAQQVDALTAVNKAKDFATRPATIAGFIKRIIITDGGDYTCFEWKYGEGVVYPPKSGGLKPNLEGILK